MGDVAKYLENATSTVFLHQLGDLWKISMLEVLVLVLKYLWKNTKNTVFRIEILTLVAIVLTFFLAAFGSCRGWSNRWIVQKGFLLASKLPLLFAAHNIAIIQYSSVKSEMFPIWAVSLFTLYGCIDPVTDYSSRDSMSQLLNIIFQLCVYCGSFLVLPMRTSTTGVSNTATGVLCVVTFLKGFHRSLALMMQGKMEKMVRRLDNGVDLRYLGVQRELEEMAERLDNGDLLKTVRDESWMKKLIVDLPPYQNERLYNDKGICDNAVNMDDIESSCQRNNELSKIGKDGLSCKVVCFALALSHLLQRRFSGLDDLEVNHRLRTAGGENSRAVEHQLIVDWQAIEVELLFLYEAFFTSKAFLHYYQAKAASFWAFALLIAICFQLHQLQFVDTTNAEIVITLVILVSLALLQLVQLIDCWTSNWARVAVACDCGRREIEERNEISRPKYQLWWMRLKMFVVTRDYWFHTTCGKVSSDSIH